ncbi:glycosyltransferase family 29 protein [Colwellia sp. 1_MG-2023]|uniref:glycosyltransferase family 29 protein n=1 Tax=unclassified Colwellia TaxID=196834 RepID=UPI001C08C385|nr:MULTISPECIES: glycosyltransferase family 29 protein [unclassified Colwellia]MBU2925113.1 glycosyltransferase family 29 protein [Colwellia sp. C2M11]MDO6653390.1 glycosyltransferase family 29 protein [Colwellia sp. 3_MG-2023]MDO6666174.1 glycosyltransferase family 29 protein [Colwellia sp. 2_MG-2023]MDO6690547.1 glycosyltransferase family 29 protein [Colwellia sp. 1_MG-2023]
MFNNLTNQPKLSVILPCYNVEQYIKEALDSVLAQTLSDIEIIPVDDGSPDNCGEIIKQYSEKYKNIKPIFKKNGGYGSAVNAGLSVATGEYIAILEPDDYIMEDYYNILYLEAISDGLDVCGVNSYCEIRDGAHPKLIQSHWVDNPDYLSFEGVNDYFASGNVGITLKIYKRSFIIEKNIALHEDLRSYHDVPFVAEVLSKSEKTRIIIGTGYYYRKDVITSTTKSKTNFISIVEAVDKVKDLLSNPLLRNKRRAALAGYCLRHLIHYFKLANSRIHSKATAEYIKSNIIDILQENKEIYIHTASKNVINNISPNYNNLKLLKANVIKFNQSPLFTIDTYTQVKSLYSNLSQLYFFSYYAYALGKDEYLKEFRERIAAIINYIPDLVSMPITHFIEKYISDATYDFPKNYNQRWYISFTLYLFKHVNKDRISLAFDSINEARTDTTIARFFPELTNKFPCEYSYLSESFRKTQVIRQSVIHKHEEFLAYIKGKSIAIVGNSPSELGKGHGKEIDSYDVVIRFNNYSTEAKYADDYGRKVNVWAITPGIESLNYQEAFYEYDFVMSPKLGLQLHEERLSIIYNYIIAGGNYFQIDTIDCRRYSDLIIPSVGLYVLHFLMKNKASIGNVGVYGFSPKTATKDNRHYFTGDPVPTSKVRFHDWDREELCINHLKNTFKEHNRKF